MATYASFIGDLKRFEKGLAGDGMAVAVGVEAKKIARQVASGDLGGDPKFSGWAPTLDTRFDVIADGILFTTTKRAAGPWTVAEKGRNQGNASGVSGPGISQKTGLTSRTKSGGLRKVQARQGKRWNGRTRGKGTATKALARIEAMVPKIGEAELVKVVRKTLGS